MLATLPVYFPQTEHDTPPVLTAPRPPLSTCHSPWCVHPSARRWLGAAAYTAALATVSSGFHSGWGLRCLGGQRGAWALTAAVAAVFLGVVSQGLGAAPVRRKKA